jgi:hypothetical protein
MLLSLLVKAVLPRSVKMTLDSHLSVSYEPASRSLTLYGAWLEDCITDPALMKSLRSGPSLPVKVGILRKTLLLSHIELV